MVTVTEIAIKMGAKLLHEENQNRSSSPYVGMRVYVKGGGCHGYQYGMAFEEKIGEDDTVVAVDGFKIIIDPQSAPFLVGAAIDYHTELQKSGFSITNPNAKSTCGCGSSFDA